MATAGSIVIDLLMRTGAFETDAKRAEKRLREMQKVAKQFGVAVGGAVVTAGTALAAVTMQAIQFADQIDEMSQRLGISTEQLSGWGYAAKLSGTSFESLTNALPKLAKNMAAAQVEGSRMAELFNAIGVATVDAQGNLRDVEDVIPDLADRFKALDNDTAEAALAMELFGRSGAEMLEFLNRGPDGIRELTDRAAELGIVIGSDTAANAAEFNDRLDDLKAIATGLGIQVADRLLPAMIALVDEFARFATEGDGATKIADGIATTFTTLSDAATIVSATIKGVMFDLIALGNVAQGLASFGPAGGIMRLFGVDAEESFRNAGVARDMAAGESGRIGNIGAGGNSSTTVNWIDPPKSGPAPGAEKALMNFLGNPTGRAGAGGGGGGISEAEKEAQSLQRAYDSLTTSLDRQQYMLGAVGEEAQVRYEIELGSLRELDPLLKDQLLTKAALLDAEIEARKEAERLEELDRRATEAFEQMNGLILEQIELVGMSADEQEIWNNLAWAGVDAESERGKEIAGNTKRLQELRDEMNVQIDMMDEVRDAAKGFLQDIREGGNPLQALEDALDRIIDKMADQIFDQWIDGFFGKQGDPGGGSGGSLLGNLFGSFFGGGKAGGGDTIAGRAYLIGEQGPEMFVPRTAGAIIPADQTEAMRGRGAGSTVVQNIAFNMPGRYDQRTQAQVAATAGRVTQRAVARGTA
jgi:hypothetical protein